MMRMRGVPPHDAVARLENDYKQMRSQTTGDDIRRKSFCSLAFSIFGNTLASRKS